MDMAYMAISIGNYWRGIVAEYFCYAIVLYLDALFAVLVILVIPFLREREERSAAKAVLAEPLPATGQGAGSAWLPTRIIARGAQDACRVSPQR